MGLAQYYELFRANGYDSMQFVVLMDGPNDLLNLGIGDEAHVQRLWHEIMKLKLGTIKASVPHGRAQRSNHGHGAQTPHTPHSPVSMRERQIASESLRRWLMEKVGLPQYFEALCLAGYDDLRFVAAMESVREVLEIGVASEAHAERMWREIVNLKKEEVVVDVREVSPIPMGAAAMMQIPSSSHRQSRSPTVSFEMV